MAFIVELEAQRKHMPEDEAHYANQSPASNANISEEVISSIITEPLNVSDNDILIDNEGKSSRLQRADTLYRLSKSLGKLTDKNTDSVQDQL